MDRKTKEIAVRINGSDIVLAVEECCPYDPAAYQLDEGWECFDEETQVIYFVSQSGDVYEQPSNNVVGIAPEIVQRNNEMEIRWEKHYIG